MVVKIANLKNRIRKLEKAEGSTPSWQKAFKNVESKLIETAEKDKTSPIIQIFSPSDNSGGLDFKHQSGLTCEEILEVRYCLEDVNPMSGANPIYIQSISQPVQIKLSNIIQNMLGSSLGDISSLDFFNILMTKILHLR